MTKMTRVDHGLHPAAHMYAGEFARGELSRREFLVRTTALGVSAAAAYALIGATPAAAQDAPKMGGTLRMSMELKALKEMLLQQMQPPPQIVSAVADDMAESQ